MAWVVSLFFGRVSCKLMDPGFSIRYEAQTTIVDHASLAVGLIRQYCWELRTTHHNPRLPSDLFYWIRYSGLLLLT